MIKIGKYIKRETGNILIIFAMTFTALVGFLGIATDVGLMYAQKTRLLEIANLIRDARFQQIEIIWNSTTPAATFDSIVREYGLKNGLNTSQITTQYVVKTNTTTTREVDVYIYITSTYNCSALKLFGYNNVTLKETIKGYAIKSKSPKVWKP